MPIFIDGIKATGAVAQPLRNSISKQRICAHLASNKSIAPQAFDKVDYDSLEGTKNTMGTQYRLWATKHVSGFYATNEMLAYRFPSHTTKYPCCKTAVIEDTRPQVHCTDPQRISIWKDSIQDINTWLSEIQTTIICYLRHKGTVSFLNSSPRSFPITTAQDEIGCDNFLEVKLTTKIRVIQAKYISLPSSDNKLTKWTTGIFSFLLKTIHSQWINRNKVVHKRNTDGLKYIEGANVRISIRSQLRLVTNGLDDEDKFLVQHTYHKINTWCGEEKNT